MTHPLAVTNCNIDMESLISDQNRSIATLAITTLLKTGSESSVERLLKQIGSFMTDIADEFKIVVVEAIRALCLKFPQARPRRRPLQKTLSKLLSWSRRRPGPAYMRPVRSSPQGRRHAEAPACDVCEARRGRLAARPRSTAQRVSALRRPSARARPRRSTARS